MADEDPEVARLLDFARRLEGMNRNVGTHAAGVVIADRPLEELVPLQKLPNKDKAKEVVTTQWEMGDIEKAGLLKMDFLGLRNLTTLEAAVRRINERHPESPIDIDHLPLDDAKTFELLQRGESKGVFQLESAGIRDLLIKMKPDRFADIIATNALYRPGPLNGGMVDEYVDVKNGRKQATYLHPVLKEVLEETYGVMVYQEQVMRILNRLGGIELSQAYATIKAISKKKADVIAQSRDQFLKGAMAQGLDRAEIGQDLRLDRALRRLRVQQVAQHGLRPGRLSDGLSQGPLPDRVHGRRALVGDGRCRARQVLHRTHRGLPPAGDRRPAAEHQRGTSRLPGGQRRDDPLRAGGHQGGRVQGRRGDREGAGAEGPFLSLDDFFERVSTKEVGAGCVETLIRAGAFDCLESAGDRSFWRSCRERIQAGQSKQDDRRRGQLGLFDDLESTDRSPRGTAETATSRHTFSCRKCRRCPTLELAGEKKALGFYMSSHPLTRHAGLLQALATHRAADLPSAPEKTEVILGGMITNVKERNVQKSRSGLTRMAKLTFEDLSGTAPAMLWPEEFAKMADLVKNDQIVFVKGTLDRRRDPAELVISRIIPLEQGPPS